MPRDFFALAEETREVQLSYGFTARVRQLTSKEDDQARDYAFGSAAWRTGTARGLVFDQTRYQTAVVLGALVSWDLTKADGSIYEPTPELIERLPAVDRDAIFNAARVLLPNLSETEPIATVPRISSSLDGTHSAARPARSH